VTAAATLKSDRISYMPREHVSAGWHDVFLEGKDAASRTFSEAWVFRTDDPDIDDPAGFDSFGFLPIGVVPGVNSPFMHFFFVSPFEGVGLVQLCGFTAPLVQAGATPVFFVTVPVTLGSVLLGCTPGIAFTPFGFAQVTPIFFPLQIAGPNIFQNPTRRRIQNGVQGPVSRSGVPVHRMPVMPVNRMPVMPVNRMPVMPVNRMPVMPVNRTPVMPVNRTMIPIYRMPQTVGVPRAVMPHMSIPHVGIPHPYIPH
jgi:hypothetical protein